MKITRFILHSTNFVLEGLFQIIVFKISEQNFIGVKLNWFQGSVLSCQAHIPHDSGWICKVEPTALTSKNLTTWKRTFPFSEKTNSPNSQLSSSQMAWQKAWTLLKKYFQESGDLLTTGN